ncbi:MAG TPA: LUD domain-containing protein [Polyangiaceae bacterium]
MSDDRALVFARIRAALATRTERTPAPSYPDGVAVSRAAPPGRELVATFVARLERVRGRAFTTPGALAAWLVERGATHGYCDPSLRELVAPAFGTAISLETEFCRARVDDYAFGVTRAVGGIAETGTLVIDDASTATRLGALAPWIHVAVVRRAELHASVGAAIAAFGDDPSVVWITGPSKTADVEGILIEGVHGPGEQVALVLDA